MSLHLAQHQYDNQEPTNDGPVEEWLKAKQIVEKGYDLLKGQPSKYGMAWQAMGPRANGRWERWIRRINKIISHYQDIVEADACAGCGDYSEGGKTHNSHYCRMEERANR